ncbi:unnamed protein product [Closterium sp. Naga37s-1]|nr:unnamed protein product [Closterium sp. Naga37s-1]
MLASDDSYGADKALEVIAQAHAAWQLFLHSNVQPEPWRPDLDVFSTNVLQACWRKYTDGQSAAVLPVSCEKREEGVPGDAYNGDEMLGVGSVGFGAVGGGMAEEDGIGRDARGKDVVEAGSRRGSEKVPEGRSKGGRLSRISPSAVAPTTATATATAAAAADGRVPEAGAAAAGGGKGGKGGGEGAATAAKALPAGHPGSFENTGGYSSSAHGKGSRAWSPLALVRSKSPGSLQGSHGKQRARSTARDSSRKSPGSYQSSAAGVSNEVQGRASSAGTQWAAVAAGQVKHSAGSQSPVGGRPPSSPSPLVGGRPPSSPSLGGGRPPSSPSLVGGRLPSSQSPVGGRPPSSPSPVGGRPPLRSSSSVSPGGQRGRDSRSPGERSGVPRSPRERLLGPSSPREILPGNALAALGGDLRVGGAAGTAAAAVGSAAAAGVGGGGVRGAAASEPAANADGHSWLDSHAVAPIAWESDVFPVDRLLVGMLEGESSHHLGVAQLRQGDGHDPLGTVCAGIPDGDGLLRRHRSENLSARGAFQQQLGDGGNHGLGDGGRDGGENGGGDGCEVNRLLRGLLGAGGVCAGAAEAGSDADMLRRHCSENLSGYSSVHPPVLLRAVPEGGGGDTGETPPKSATFLPAPSFLPTPHAQQPAILVPICLCPSPLLVLLGV